MGQYRDLEGVQSRDAAADVWSAQQRAEAYAEKHQGQSAGELIGLPGDHQQGQDQVEERARGRPGQDTQRGAARAHGGRETGHRPHQHDAFQAQIHNAGPLHDHLTQRGVQYGHS